MKLKYAKHTWDAFWFWVDWQGRLASVMLFIVAAGGAALSGKIASIWANVTGIYLYMVIAMSFVVFLGTVAMFARKSGTPSKVVAENEEDSKPEEGQPNIGWTTISMQKLVFENGRFRRFVPYESAPFVLGMFMVVTNSASKDKKVISAGDVKAQLLFKLKQGEYDISPAAWVDEPYSSVRLDVGDTRHLLIAVSTSYTSDWKMVSNRRTSEAHAISTDYTRDFPLFSEGTLEINLIGVQSGSIIRTWKARISWPHGYALGITQVEQS
jgi:hypothetical protein